MFQYELLERAKAGRRHIVLPEGEDERVLRAADILLRRQVVDLTILGVPEDVRTRAAAQGLVLDRAQIVDPLDSPMRAQFAEMYHELRKHKGVTLELAMDAVADPSYFGTLMVQTGAAHGMVSGAAHTTAATIRPAFEIIKLALRACRWSRACSSCAWPTGCWSTAIARSILQPDAGQLADIAISSAETAGALRGRRPGSRCSPTRPASPAAATQVDVVRGATELVRERQPELKVEGPIQYDAAVDTHVAELKLPGSEVAGRATVFIFPDLDTGNVAYKAVQRSTGAIAIGPVLQGLRKPVNDLSRGCTVPDIVNTVAITAVQAQGVTLGVGAQPVELGLAGQRPQLHPLLGPDDVNDSVDQRQMGKGLREVPELSAGDGSISSA